MSAPAIHAQFFTRNERSGLLEPSWVTVCGGKEGPIAKHRGDDVTCPACLGELAARAKALGREIRAWGEGLGL